MEELHIKKCYFCGSRYNLHKHHIYMGANRKISDKIGAWTYLCADHHNMSDDSVHFNKDKDLELKQKFERLYLENHTLGEFIKKIRKKLHIIMKKNKK